MVGTPHFCRMNETVTFPEAWQHFYAWMQSQRDAGHITMIPKDIQEAHYAQQGKRRAALGEKRIKRLLEKYGKGRYMIVEGVILPPAD